MEELLLRPLLSRQKLDVVDHQHIDMAIPLSEVHHLVVADGIDDLVRKLLCRQIGNPQVRTLRHMIGNGVQQVGLAKPHTSVDEQGVIRLGRLLGDRHAGGVGELIPGADDEILE